MIGRIVILIISSIIGGTIGYIYGRISVTDS